MDTEFRVIYGNDDTADLECLKCHEYIPIFNTIFLSKLNNLAKEHWCEVKEKE